MKGERDVGRAKQTKKGGGGVGEERRRLRCVVHVAKFLLVQTETYVHSSSFFQLAIRKNQPSPTTTGHCYVIG